MLAMCMLEKYGSFCPIPPEEENTSGVNLSISFTICTLFSMFVVLVYLLEVSMSVVERVRIEDFNVKTCAFTFLLNSTCRYV